MAKTKRRLSDIERAERRRRDRERLQQAAEQLLTSEGWRRWTRVRSRAGLARLSLSNQLLVALARPDATFVAGFRTWLGLGFAVSKGEHGIAIVAPLPVKERDRVSGEQTSETLVLFKPGSCMKQSRPRLVGAAGLSARAGILPVFDACRIGSGGSP